MKKIIGLLAAPYTPFDKKGALNTTIIPEYAEHLKKNGVIGVFINGTTGEGASLSAEERIIAAEEWIKEKSDEFMVLIHVGHDSLVEAKRLAIHAGQIKADGIAAMPPVFFKPTELDSLISYSHELARIVPDLPFYYYHIPSMTGVHFPMIDFLRKAEKMIPNLAGIKYSHQDFMDMKLCLEYADRKYNILHGSDEILTYGMALGITGAIGSTYNYLAPLFLKILEAIKQGNNDLADKYQYQAIRIIEILIKYGGGVKAGKSFMRLAGLDFGTPRLPVRALSEPEEINLKKELKVLGFPGRL